MQNIVPYSLSPIEQHAFPEYFSKAIPKVLHRTLGRILTWLRHSVVSNPIYIWGNQEFE
ncbi:cytochrome b-c1 complex subunit 8-like [Meriones unguiculatus]|uniref:cytochrome b-c1 complex subunit 8-like n=1 Tax=Meriones unguiculatus TaxID=10047 RepID=UPI00293EF1CC|nr:cytochrome b-c1 complex subunit 8-like [Meriones unguiculatus]